MISTSKLVNVNFEVAQNNVPTGGYPRTLLMSPNATVRVKEYSTLAEVEVDFDNTKPEYAAAQLYFNNNGQILVIGQIDGAETLLEAVQAVELEFTDYIFVAFLEKNPDSAEAQALVTDFDARVAPNKKIACFTVTDVNAINASNDTDLMSVLIAAGLQSAASKYATEIILNTYVDTTAMIADQASQVIGGIYDAGGVGYRLDVKTGVIGDYTVVLLGQFDAVLIGAYFSQIDLNGVETIQDYAFTSETGVTVVDLTDAEYDALIAKNYNFYTTIGNNSRNYGGDIASGVGLDVVFGTITVENDVTESALTALLEKQYLTDGGTNNIVTAINDAIVRYVTNGFIDPGSTYLGESQVITYNSKDFPTIRKGQTLVLGYLVFTIPVAEISTADRAARKLPPISVFINARGSIRQIDINGEVRE